MSEFTLRKMIQFLYSHVVYLESTSTYRATVIYEISGTGGATDVIEYEWERTYS